MLQNLALFYFFSYAAVGAFVPFLALLLATRGLSATEISFVLVVNPLLNLVVPPIWGILADTFRARVMLLRLVTLGAAGGTALFLVDQGLPGALFAMVVLCTFRSPIASLADSATHAELGKNPFGFARIRVWGSVGFGALAATSGFLGGSHRPRMMILSSVSLMLAACFVTTRLASPALGRERAVLRRVLSYATRADLWILFVANAFYYAAHAVFDGYIGLHLRNLGHSDAFVGLVWCVGVFCEVALMMRAPAIIARRRSSHLLVFCSSVAVVRWLLIATVTNGPMLVAVQCLHSVTFGLWYLSLVAHVQRSAPSELRTSVQAMLLASMGIGTVTGSLAGGSILDAWGGEWLFRGAAAAALSATGLYVIAGRRSEGRADRFGDRGSGGRTRGENALGE